MNGYSIFKVLFEGEGKAPSLFMVKSEGADNRNLKIFQKFF